MNFATDCNSTSTSTSASCNDAPLSSPVGIPSSWMSSASVAQQQREQQQHKDQWSCMATPRCTATGRASSSSTTTSTSTTTTNQTSRPSSKSRLGHVLADRIQITSVIGSGPYSVVYSAVDFYNSETVALKVIPKRGGNVSITFPNPASQRHNHNGGSNIPVRRKQPSSAAQTKEAGARMNEDQHGTKNAIQNGIQTQNRSHGTGLSTDEEKDHAGCLGDNININQQTEPKSLSKYLSVSESPTQSETSRSIGDARSITNGKASKNSSGSGFLTPQSFERSRLALSSEHHRPHSMLESSTIHTRINAKSLGLHEVFRRYDYLVSCGLFDSKCPLHIAYREVALHGKASQACPTSVVQVKMVFESEDYIFVVMEYCPAGDLFHAITDLKWYSGNEARIKNTFLQLVNVVSQCHDLNIYHCDLKPENILVSKDGSTIKLADFGLATSNAVCHDYGCGSSFYMSPERLTTSNNNMTAKKGFSSAASDTWALGIILLNLTCGRNPWKKACLHEDASYTAFVKDSKFLEKIMPITPEFNHLLLKIFDVDPRKRLSLAAFRDQVMACHKLTTISTLSPVSPAANTSLNVNSIAHGNVNSRNMSSSSLASMFSEDQEYSTASTSPVIISSTSSSSHFQTHYYHHKLQACLQGPTTANSTTTNGGISAGGNSRRRSNISALPSPIAVPSSGFDSFSVSCYGSSPPLSNDSPNLMGSEAFLQSPTPMTPGRTPCVTSSSPVIPGPVTLPMSPLPVSAVSSGSSSSMIGLLPALPLRQHLQQNGFQSGFSGHSHQSRTHYRSSLVSSSHPYSRPSPKLGSGYMRSPKGPSSPSSHMFFSPHGNSNSNNNMTVGLKHSSYSSTSTCTSAGLGLSASPYSTSFESPMTPQAHHSISESSSSCSCSSSSNNQHHRPAAIYFHDDSSVKDKKQPKFVPSLLSPLT